MDDFKTAPEENLQVCDGTDEAVKAFAAGAPVLHNVICYLVVSEVE
jgi:hypothetical protein